ncbi:MAG TPA: 50S ribosomal protein L25 [Candidatus Pacearchaeota archaeon]|nr:50S ribosomal protein L25 [Candidatus Parcubacteria bacterium]HNP79720.1 50S ribosomal protein L25 [Candidatus Pacearchaeota archaeon]HOC53864.1 50S ribosomal protein L25 [Candidatus Pacearchaeota archaeon]HQM24581.1 50S ribosomal protein L25 [Candidatus Pacearchaeota archaeon]
MLKIEGKIRENKHFDSGNIPAVLYGPGLENILLQVEKNSFDKVFKESGETLIELKIGDKAYSVLVYDIQKHPYTGELIHVDFYQPNLKEEVETEVPLELEGEAPAVKNLGGTLITNIKELSIKALPKDLPSKIKINVSNLNTFDDFILVKDIEMPKGVIVLDNPEEIVVQVVEPEKVEEELAKPVEEKMPEVVEKKEEAKEEEK